jgi:hypothetical protein
MNSNLADAQPAMQRRIEFPFASVSAPTDIQLGFVQ